MESKIENRCSANEAIDQYILGVAKYNWKHQYIPDMQVPYCDHKKGLICSPALPPMLDVDEDRMVRAKNEHEAGHARFTPRGMDEGWSELKCRLVNSLEDLRIEKLVGGLSDMFKDDLSWLNKKLIQRLQNRLKSGDMDINPSAEAMLALHMEGNGYAPNWDMSFAGKMLYDAAKEIYGEWKDTVNAPNGYDMVIAIADKIISIWEQMASKSNTPQEGNSGEGKQQKQNGNSNGKSAGHSKPQEDDSEDGQQNGGSGSQEQEDGESQDGENTEDDGSEDGAEEQQGNDGSENDEGNDGSKNDGSENDGSKNDGSQDDSESGDNGSQDDANSGSQNGDMGGDSNGSANPGNGSSKEDGEEDAEDGQDGRKSTDGDNDASNDKEDSQDASDKPTQRNILDCSKDDPSIQGELEQEWNEAVSKSEQVFGDYTAYTDEDEVIRANEDQDSFNQAYNEVRGGVSALAGHLEQSLRSMSRCRTMHGRDKGALDVTRLATIAKSLDRNIFTSKVKGISLDVSVSILIDESGSIDSMAYDFRRLAVAFSEALERLGIKFEILGHTTHGWVIKQGYTRTMPLTIYEHKNFNEPYRKERFRLGSIGSSEYNIDGEALLYTAKRAAQQKTSRHIILVLSDGLPNQGHSKDHLINHLKTSIEYCRRTMGMEVYAFGIGTRLPGKYYGEDNFVYLPDSKTLGPAFMKRFASIVLNGCSK